LDSSNGISIDAIVIFLKENCKFKKIVEKLSLSKQRSTPLASSWILPVGREVEKDMVKRATPFKESPKRRTTLPNS
jgi:hypothetical protein